MGPSGLTSLFDHDRAGRIEDALPDRHPVPFGQDDHPGETDLLIPPQMLSE